jgi:hypothetical protein
MGLGCGAAVGQTHAVKGPESVVRAVGVYEWTGDEAKPTASRLVPVSIFINSAFEDAGVYMTRPAPLALDRGTVFEAQEAGRREGTLEVGYQRHFEGVAGTVFDDGWVGYGAFKPVAKETVIALKKGGTLPVVVASGGRGAKPEAEAEPAKVDEDRPTMRRRDPDASATATRVDAGDGEARDDVDRPTLRRRTVQQQKDEKKKRETASVTGGGSLNDDPDRPTLHRGQGVGDSVSPLLGLPKEMRQMVAVSDAKDREEHGFGREWESETERAETLTQMEALARARLEKFAPAAAVVEAAAPVGNVPARAGVRGKKAVAVAAPAAAPVELVEETLRGFTLSYGGAATFVYTAASPGAGGVTRYVTVVAQREGASGLKAAMTSVTDSSHLDRTPWMRFVDVVDAEASNRASLLFEMRGQTVRQFALYRVIGAQAEQVFETGTTP